MKTRTFQTGRGRSSPLFRVLGLAFASVTSVAIVAGTAQEITRSNSRSTLSETTTVIDLGERGLRMNCTGSGDRTYVLEAGATGFAETWTWVQDVLDDEARVCSYDRAGMGLSDPAPGAFEPARVAADLRAALSVAGEEGPFILVGHSLGGFLIRDFAAQNPEEIAALVFVDSSHEDQLSVMTEEAAEMTRSFPDMLHMLSVASRTGILKLWNPLAAGAEGLEGDALRKAEFFAADRVHLATSADEMDHWAEISNRIRAQQLRRTIPVLAVTAGAPVEGQPNFVEAFSTLHQQLAAGSDHGRHVVLPDADHFSILMDREQGELLARQIVQFAEQLAD